MTLKTGWRARAIALLNEGGPWGGRGSGGGSGGGGNGDGPRNPWSQPPNGGRPRGPGRNSALDEIGKRLRTLGGGGGGSGGGFGGLPSGGDIWPIARFGLIALVGIWIFFTSFWQIGPQQQGVVTRFGSFNSILQPGVGATLPWPIDSVRKVDVRAINRIDIGSAESENLVLTGDRNIVDLAYSIRWDIRDPALYLFQLAEPDDTIKEVGESAMREVLSQFTLNDAIGSGRTRIEQQVQQRMQVVLNTYKAGVRIQGIAIKKAVPPAEVIEAFKQVSAAQQTAQTAVNQSRAYAQQITARAEGEAAQFNKVYDQYKLAPGVTRRRMYYETMEEVLGRVDKTIIEAPGVTPYLPLPELKRRATPVEEPAK
ncbi:MAG: FtsH protease activity modulator HflK [Sphingomonadaceae bacterium]